MHVCCICFRRLVFKVRKVVYNMYVLFTRYGHIEHPYESCSMTVQCHLLWWDEPNQYLPYLSLFTAVFFHCIVPFKYVLSIHLLAVHYSAVPVVVGWNHCVVRCCVIFLVFFASAAHPMGHWWLWSIVFVLCIQACLAEPFSKWLAVNFWF